MFAENNVTWPCRDQSCLLLCVKIIGMNTEIIRFIEAAGLRGQSGVVIGRGALVNDLQQVEPCH